MISKYKKLNKNYKKNKVYIKKKNKKTKYSIMNNFLEQYHILTKYKS